jgi:hypothetical protein
MDKAHILHEIKRTAAANGGVPLGRQRFSSETGIKPSDWFGIHWARWSEALCEAGFTPNQLSEAYEKAELLDKFANLALELARLPTDADMRLKAHHDVEFPSTSTFHKCLGAKAELVVQLAEHCRARKELEGVVRWCEEYVPRSRKPHSQPEAMKDMEIGYVYLVKSGRFYKIGRTNSVGRREYELTLQLPEEAKSVHVIRTDDPDGIEEYWHKRFAAKRKNGEWFELDAADIAAFKRRKFM